MATITKLPYPRIRIKPGLPYRFLVRFATQSDAADSSDRAGVDVSDWTGTVRFVSGRLNEYGLVPADKWRVEGLNYLSGELQPLPEADPDHPTPDDPSGYMYCDFTPEQTDDLESLGGNEILFEATALGPLSVPVRRVVGIATLVRGAWEA